MNKPYSDPHPTGFVGVDREVKGSKNLFEVVGITGVDCSLDERKRE